MKNKRTRTLIQILIVMTIVFLFMKIQPFIKPILEVIGMLIAPIIIGGFIYYALRPLKKLILKLVKNHGVAAILTILIVLAFITIVIINGGAVVKEQFEDTFVNNREQFTEYRKYVEGKIQEVLPDLNLFQRISDNIKGFATSIGSNALGIFSSVGAITTQFILTPFILFYLLKDGKLFKEKLFSIIPNEHKDKIKDMFKRIDDILSTYINGQLLVATVIGILMFIAYLIIGMPNALLMAVFSLITSVIPFIGPILGILPAMLIALTIDFGLVIKIIIATLIVQQLESNLITPNIMGSKLKLHPLAVIIIVIISINLFGILGAFIGTPLFLVIGTVGKTLYSIKKDRPRESKIN